MKPALAVLVAMMTLGACTNEMYYLDTYGSVPIQRRQYDDQTFGVRDLADRRRLVVDRRPAITSLIGLAQGVARDVAAEYLASTSPDCTITDSAVLKAYTVYEFFYTC